MLGEVQSQFTSFHDNVILTIQNESHRIRKHVFLGIPTKKRHLLEDAIVSFGRAWMKQVATVALRPET